ncbi:beta-lactamase/transpeptidase-like protein [Hyaloscypha hepaticicola]|uniref:Beta-lactamase/transpeptidase-like protein n=1 Tax=Hyaloscypha hepaticicola TaxID=2082293 RepID=A0A2J6Q8D1_9HELO|nr:beta-lactamase/transpeptidase-like protein [Hyaloscypha hepaticicola]
MSTEASIPKSTDNLQGFSKEGLAELDARFHALIDEGQQANVVNLIARHGQIVHCDAYGVQDVSATPPVPVKTDSIYRIASMTKPLTSAVAMMLWEEGKWALEDPVSKFIPEFEGLKVKQENGELVAQASPMTMKQLMSHTAGFAGRTEYPAELRAGDLQHMIDYLAKQPLSYQPGKEWRYGPSVDILGYIIQKLTGKGVDAVLQERLLGPLGMVDTGYVLPESKFARLVSNHKNDDNGKLQAIPLAGTYNAVRPRFIGAGGGLMLSTVKDYWRFCQMILNGGEFEGKRYLKASTVELMHTNVLEPGVTLNFQARSFGPIGFGLGFAIVYDHVDKKTSQAAGSFWWGGLFGTWFWIDPVNDLIVIGLINSTTWQTPVGVPVGRELSAKLVYKALNA